MAKGSIYGDPKGLAVQTRLAPGRFDRSSANSEKPLAASQFDRNKVARVQKGLVSIARVCRLQPLIALPSLLPSFQCSMPVWSSSGPLLLLLPLLPLLLLLQPKKKRKSLRSAALHVCLHDARSEKRSRTGGEDPRLRPQAMVPEYKL